MPDDDRVRLKPTGRAITVEAAGQAAARLTVRTSPVLGLGTIHRLAAVTDSGTSAFTRKMLIVVDLVP